MQDSAGEARYCGNKPAGGSWTYEGPDGAGDYNLRTRNVSCTKARRMVDTIRYRQQPPYEPYRRGWRCRYVRRAIEFGDIRCTASRRRVVRWQTGA